MRILQCRWLPLPQPDRRGSWRETSKPSGTTSQREIADFFSRRMVMRTRLASNHHCVLAISVFFAAVFSHSGAIAADKLVVLFSAHSMSQSMPWIAQAAGLLKKYDLDMELVYVGGGPRAAAATV